MSENRKKMSNRNFMLIVLPIVILLVAVCIIATVVMNSFSYLMDMQFGRGERHVVAAEGTEKWDTDYYEVKYETPEEAKEASLKVNQKITDEGMILLKNNGVLPLAKGAKVTPFGKGYKFPHYDSPNGTASMKHSFAYAVTPEQALISSGFDIVTCAADLQPETTSTNKKVGDSQNDGSDYNNYPDQPQPAEGTMAINRNSFGSNSRIPELGEYRYDELTDADKALIDMFNSGVEGTHYVLDENGRFALPEGCTFAPRCPYATEACTQTVPELRKMGGTHFVACHAYDDPSFRLRRNANG